MKLKELAEIVMGQSPPSSSYNGNGQGLPFYQGKTDFGFIHPTPRAYCTDPKKIANCNDILLSVRAPVGPVNIAKEKSCIGRGLSAIRAKHINYKFLYFNLIFQKEYIESLGTGSTFQAINKAQIEDLEISEFNPSEQRKIAYILSTIQSAIEKQEELIRVTTELKKALMHKLFTEGLRGEKQKMTEIGPVPESWEVVEINQMYVFTKKPNGLNISKVPYVPFIPMELIPLDKLKITEYIEKKGNEIRSGTYVENGDLLLAKITPSFENGKQGILEIEQKLGYATTEVIPIKEIPYISDKYFLFYYLLKDDIRGTLAGKMEGSTGRQRLSKSVLGETLIPKPNLKEQQEISNILKALDRKIILSKRKINSLDELFKNLLNQLMTGQIRVDEIRVGECLGR